MMEASASSIKKKYYKRNKRVRPKEEQEEDIGEIARLKRFSLKPMDAEEAILQMNLLGHNFFVFLMQSLTKSM